MSNAINIGDKFERWTVIDYAQSNKHRAKMWMCRCDCGTERIVSANSLKNGASKSCGCYHSDIMKDVGHKANTTHGMSETRLYAIYKHMLNRCYNVNDISYKNYGQRGVIMCDEWKESFESFMNWALANGYKDNLSIDRINVESNYSPSNCRWSTEKEQANNRRSNRNYTYNGETHNITEWAEIYNMNYKKLWKRLNTGWTIERALTT